MEGKERERGERMSKKKASGASTTMTLKDFHGGSIPSDLRLPSAPGVIARPSGRLGFDRQGSWGNPIGRSDHRLRPGSAGSVRNFDDKNPFLSPSAHIGRNFDEDERKPLDDVSGPRRTVGDESIRALPMRTELKPDYSSTGRFPNRHISSPASQVSSSNSSSFAQRVAEATDTGGNSQNFGGNSSYSARFAEAANVGVNSPNLGGNSGQAASGTYPNAWAIKEAVGITEPLSGTWSGPNAASKLAHASALEKVSSGRWQSRQTIHHPTDVEDFGHTAIEGEFHFKGDSFYNKNSYHPMDVAGGVEYHGAMLVRHSERSLTLDDGVRGGGRELPTYEQARSPMFLETIESNPPSYVDGVPPAHNDGKFAGSELQPPVHSEQSERPKLKLLPRSKPLESSETPIDYKEGYQQPHNSDHLDNFTESYGNEHPTKSGLAVSDIGNRAVERPKLNLKLRSQPLEQLEGNIKRERNTLFGGARPRELVLKERGTDDVAVDNHDAVQPPSRVKQEVPRTETVPTHATPTHYNEKAENIPLDNRIRKNNDRRDNRVDVERTDMQRNWRSEKWRNNRETEKHQHKHQHEHKHEHEHQPQERPPSPETWRKPAEQPKPAYPNASGLRYGKATSAVELAQAFSRSVSDPKTADQFPGPRGTPDRAQMPFSRLTDPNSRPQINGY